MIRDKLAMFMHRIAAYIGGDSLVHPPVAVAMVLERADGTHELLWVSGDEPMTRERLKECGRALIKKAGSAPNLYRPKLMER